MIKDAPIFGTGPGNFSKVFPEYSPPRITEKFRSPHSHYLYILSGWGLLGAIIFFGFLGTTIIKPLLKYRHPMQVVAFSMVMSFWIHVLVEDLFIPHVAVIMGCIANSRLVTKDDADEPFG